MTDNQPKNNTGKVIGTILLVMLGVAIILVMGIFLGRAMTPAPPAVDTSEPTVMPPTPQPDSPYAVANEAVNVRSGPSTDYPSYGVAQPGQSAEVIGKSPDGGWWLVKLPTSVAADGQGWVSGDYVSAYNVENVPIVQPPVPPPDVKPTPPAPGAPYVITTEPVNVRSGPGNEFPSYGKVSKGIPLQAVSVSENGRWVQVMIPAGISPDNTGWVNAAYVELVDLSGVPQQ